MMVPCPAFSVTEMLTTAGITFLTMGAKLGSATLAGLAGCCVCCAPASGAKTSIRAALAASVATRRRRYDGGEGEEGKVIGIDLVEGCFACLNGKVARWDAVGLRSGNPRTIGLGRLRRAFGAVKSM